MLEGVEEGHLVLQSKDDIHSQADRLTWQLCRPSQSVSQRES